MQIYGSFVTDFSAATSTPESNFALSTWDIFTVTSGAAFTVSGLDLTSGIGYSFGRDDLESLIKDPVSGEVLRGSPIRGQIRYRKWKYLIGFAFSI